MALETCGPWSETTVSSAPEPRSFFRSGSLSLTASEIATALPSWSMVAITARLGLPLVRVMETRWEGCCLTVAMSPRRTVAPCCGLIRRSSICFSEVYGAPTWTVRLLPSSENEPPGMRGAARLQGVAERHRVEAGRGQLLRVGRDVDLEILDAVDADAADALDVLQGRDDRAVQLVGERLLVLVGGDREHDGRHVVGGAGHDLRVDFRGGSGCGTG